MFKLLIIVFSFFISSFSYADNDPKRVIVSGTGGTRELALNNAFRHAVEQAVGLMVSSESYVRNLKGIQDNILMVSNGFVESYEIVNEEHDTSGYAITLSAVVRRNQLQKALESTTGTSFAVSGSVLMANQSLYEGNVSTSKKIITNLLDDLVKNGFGFEFSKPVIQKQDSGLYVISFDKVRIFIKKEWVASSLRYKDSLGDASQISEALAEIYKTVYPKSSYYDRLALYFLFGFAFELQDADGKVIGMLRSTPLPDVRSDNHQLAVQTHLYLDDFLDLLNNQVGQDGITYYLLSNAGFANHVFFQPMSRGDIDKVSKITASAFVVSDYGGLSP